MTHTGLLVSDLDGTLIPLAGNAEHRSDLQTLSSLLREREVQLAFCTGRHLASILDAIVEFALPKPTWIIADVGTSIFRRTQQGSYEASESYRVHLDTIVAKMPIEVLKSHLASISHLRLQEDEKQGRHKLSFYIDADRLDNARDKIERQISNLDAPFSVIASVDPFNGDGLIDLLPRDVSKAYAVHWLIDQSNVPVDRTVFAGDSGNDLAVFLSGIPSVLVANADRSLAEFVEQSSDVDGTHPILYLAKKEATSGVLEGCHHYGLL